MTHKSTFIITPNRRRSAFLRQEYDKMQQAHHMLWKSPIILPLETWVEQLWLQYGDADTPLLKAAEPEILCAQRCASHQTLLPIDTQHIMSAYERLLGWEIPLCTLASYA